AAKKAASLDPAVASADGRSMAQLVQQYMSTWYANGGGLFAWFTAGATSYDTNYGTWGLTNDMTNAAAPKIAGVDAVRAAAPPAAAGGNAAPGAFNPNLTVSNTNPNPPPTTQQTFLGAGTQLEYLVRAPLAGPAHAAAGQPLTFSATVTAAAGQPSGSVSFYDGQAPLGSAALDATGRASLTVPGLAGGDHLVTAVYFGGGGFNASASPAV